MTTVSDRPATAAFRAQPDPRTNAKGSERRRTWLWLLVGALLLPVTNLQTLIPVAAWLAPVFLLRFTRAQRPWLALPIVALAIALGGVVGMRGGFFPIGQGLAQVLLIVGIGVGGAVPYAVDRLLWRVPGVARTLVFPLAVTGMELLATVGNPFGTAGSTAYSQYAGLPLLQLASVTGIWGLTFLVSWLAPVVNEIWERGFDGAARRAAVLFVAVLCGVLLFGGARLAFAGADISSVRVAALAPNRALSDLAYSTPQSTARTTTERAKVRQENLAPVLDDLFARSQREAQAGAKIISWSEAAGLIFEEDQAAVVARAAQLADQEDVYLQISMVVLLAGRDGSDGRAVNENHAVLLDPQGQVVWDYLKSKPTPGDGNAPGPGLIPTVDTPYGRLATAICQDDFFPSLIRQAGRADVDVLLVPSSDWGSVADWHAQQAPFRAVENGVALVRATRQGVSLSTDGYGRLMGYKSDYFVAEDQTLVTSVPTTGADPLYRVLGDGVAYASVLALLLLAGLAWRNRRR